MHSCLKANCFTPPPLHRKQRQFVKLQFPAHCLFWCCALVGVKMRSMKNWSIIFGNILTFTDVIGDRVETDWHMWHLLNVHSFSTTNYQALFKFHIFTFYFFFQNIFVILFSNKTILVDNFSKIFIQLILTKYFWGSNK